MVRADKLTIPATNRPRRGSNSSNLSTSFEGREGMLNRPVPIKAILCDDPKQKNNQKIKGKAASTTKPVALFSHLFQYAKEVERVSPVGIHPAIIKFALRSADYENLGGSRRCLEMLQAFKEVIRDYRANPEMAICRHMDLYLKPMIGHIVAVRPMAISMANAVRSIRHYISVIPPEAAEHEAQGMMCNHIDNYIMNRFDLADRLIISHGASKIADGDVILTYARSVVVRDLLLSSWREGKRFRVIVADSRPFQEGKILLAELVEMGIPCTYIHINAAGYMMREVTKTIVGAAGMYANGTLLSRIGTATICTQSRRCEVPVIVCCETVKFSDRSQIDSFVFNELGDPDALVHSETRMRDPSLPSPLSGWREMAPLKLLNILYDVTHAECISVVITEIGLIPVTSIPVVLREYSSIMGYGSTTN